MISRLTTRAIIPMILASCAIMPPPTLPPNVTAEPGAGGHHYLQAATYQFVKRKTDRQKIEACTAINVSNGEVTLGDTSSSFIGTYSGNYYQINNSKTSAGGNAMIYASKGLVVANGVTSITHTTGSIIPVNITNFIRFKLTIDYREDQGIMLFNDMESAQASTGTLPNTGFRPIGVWDGARPLQHIAGIEKVAQQLKKCFYTL